VQSESAHSTLREMEEFRLSASPILVLVGILLVWSVPPLCPAQNVQDGIEHVVVTGGKAIWRVFPSGTVEPVVICTQGIPFSVISPTGHCVYGTGGLRTGRGIFENKQRAGLENLAISFHLGTDVPEYWDQACFSADASQVALRCRIGRDDNIFILTLGAFRPLTRFTGAVITQLSWSPDGRALAFYCDPTGRADPDFYRGPFELWTVDLAGNARKLANAGDVDVLSGARSIRPVWSPDGQRVYFSSRPDRASKQVWCYVSTPGTGQDPEPLGHGVPSSISPDGRFIYVTSLEQQPSPHGPRVRPYRLSLGTREVTELQPTMRWPKSSLSGTRIVSCSFGTTVLLFADAAGLVTRTIDLVEKTEPLGIQDWDARVHWVRPGESK